MKKFIITLTALLSLSAMFLTASAQGTSFQKTKTYTGGFSDVKQTDWFYNSVKDVYELSLMEGVSAVRFDADGIMNIAQGITIASRLHSIYNEKVIDDVENAANWYDKYIMYAVDNGIITDTQFADYTAYMKSYEFAIVISNTFDESYFTAINQVSLIPDVPESLPYYDSVLMLYKAGIFNGNDSTGTFLPESSLTRKRASAIITRIALTDTRVKFTLDAPKSTYSVQDIEDIVSVITPLETLDNFTMLTISGFPYSVALYRQYYTILSDSYKGDELNSAVIQNLKLHAAITQTAKDEGISLPLDYLRDFYLNFYKMKYNYGTDFPLVLELYGTTERALCNDELILQLYNAQKEALFGIDAKYGFTKQQVIDYAKQNDFICAKHVLISNTTPKAEEVAKAVHEKALAGEDFDTLIEEYGSDPGAKTNPDGYFFTKGQTVEPFEKAAYALENGKISEIVQTSYGYHIIKRLEFDEQKFTKSSGFKYAANTLTTQKSNEYYSKIMEGLKVELSGSYTEFLKLMD